MYQVKNKILDKGSSHKSLKKQTRFFFTFRYIIIDLLVLYRHDITEILLKVAFINLILYRFNQ